MVRTRRLESLITPSELARLPLNDTVAQNLLDARHDQSHSGR